MTREKFKRKLRETFDELLLNQYDLINSEEVEEGDKEMLTVLYILFQTAIDDEQMIEMLYKSRDNLDYYLDDLDNMRKS